MYDVIVFTETWLTDSVFNAEILCNKYQIYRYNRNKCRGGGVLVAVSSLYPSEEFVTHTSNIEFVAVVVKLKTSKIYVSCSYVPPDSDSAVYSAHVDAIKSVVLCTKEEDSVVVMGDFNLPSISWKHVPDVPYLVPIKNKTCHDEFINDIFGLSLYEINSLCNDFGKILDLVFVNDVNHCVVLRSEPVTLPEDRYHPTLKTDFFLPTGFKAKPPKARKEYCFNRTNYNLFNDMMRNTCWNEILSISVNNDSDIDLMISNFYKKLYSIMEICVPLKHSYTLVGPPWNSKQLSRLKNRKNKYYKKYQRSGSIIDYGRYSISRSEFNILNQLLYKTYLNKVKNNFIKNPRSFYTFVNSKRKSTGFPSVMKLDDKESCSVDVICDMFADFFASTYSNAAYDDTNMYPYSLTSAQVISIPTFSDYDILVNLKSLKISYRPGPDGVPSCILNRCAE